MIIHTVKWISRIHWTRIFLVGFLYTVFATIVHFIEAFVNLNYYMMPEYYGVWSKIMMPNPGPPPLDFQITSAVITFVSGISLALVYTYVRDMLPKRPRERVLMFADLVVGLQFVFFTLPAYLLFNIPLMLLVSWFITSFIILTFTSYLCVRIIK